jgi:tetratricopeptide (TPR) repeat protein
VLLGPGGGVCRAGQRAEQERAVSADLEEVAALLQASKLPEARVALARAEGRVAGGAPAALLRRVRQMRDDLGLVDTLDRIRLQAVTAAGGKLDFAPADRGYAALFRERGLAAEGEDPAAVAARVQQSAVRAQLVAALDDWASATGDRTRRAWLLAVARGADPGAWGDRFRDPAVWGDRAALERLARDANVAELSPQLLTALGLALGRTGADPVPLLRAAQERHPADFWLNFHLGNALARSKPEEAVGYYRAALAVRPDAPVVYTNLGSALYHKGRLDDAIRAYRRALALAPRLALAHTNLGLALHQKGDPDGAIACYRRALALDPKDVKAHSNLGNALLAKGLLDEAIAEYRRAIALDPTDAKAHYSLGAALHKKGRLDEAIEAYRAAITLDPKLAAAHNNLGSALQDKGRLGEAIQEYRRAIELDPKDARAHCNLGVALAAKGDLDGAIAAFRRALELDPKDARARRHLGNALKAKGRPDEASRE